MKIFSIRNVLAVAAVYGANQYAKKNGGWRNAAQGLLDKVRTAADQRPGAIAGAAGGTSSTGIGSRSVGAGNRDRPSSGGGEATSSGTSGPSGNGGRRS